MEDSNYIDPILQQDYTSVDTKDPILPKQNYKLEVLSVKGNRSESGTSTLRMLYKTVDEEKDVTGTPVPKGHLISGTIFLTPNEYNSEADIKKTVKRFMEACGTPGGTMAPFEQWTGKIVNARVKITKAKGEFPERNEVAGFVV